MINILFESKGKLIIYFNANYANNKLNRKNIIIIFELIEGNLIFYINKK